VVPRAHRAPRDALSSAVTPPAISIREAGPGDGEVMAGMRLALESEGGSNVAEDPGFRRAVDAWFSEHVGTEGFRAWVAEDADGHVVGFGGLVLISRPPYTHNPSGIEGLVTSMYTLPERRREGIGASILRAMLAAAREAGAGRLVLYSSKGAESLYRRFGFTGDVERGARLHRWLEPADRSDP